jgi:thioredoxin
MPVLVDAERCPCDTPCFPAKMCPYDVLHFDFEHRTLPATLDPNLCGDCKGICTNFCDPRALRFAPTMAELRLIEAELLGSLTNAEIAAERKKLKEQQERQKQAAVIEVTTASFEQEVLRAELPVAVDFWATWCGPCKSFAPVFAKAAEEYAGKLKFCKIDTDKEQSLAQAMRIQSIPTLAFFYRGQVLGAIPGAMSAAQLRATIDQVLRGVQSMPPPEQAQPAPPPARAEFPTAPAPKTPRGRIP